jgi:hypothetical protein
MILRAPAWAKAPRTAVGPGQGRPKSRPNLPFALPVARKKLFVAPRTQQIFASRIFLCWRANGGLLPFSEEKCRRAGNISKKNLRVMPDLDCPHKS